MNPRRFEAILVAVVMTLLPIAALVTPSLGTEASRGITGAGAVHGGALVRLGIFRDHQVAELDWCDAPVPYPQVARHVVQPDLFLGPALPPDPEPGAQPHPDALADDLAGIDDEDGVVLLTPLVPCQQATVRVTSSRSNARLSAWIDYNGDGDWSDLGENLFYGQPLNAGPNDLPVIVPCDAVPTSRTFARFRLTAEGGVPYSDNPQQPPIGGEVEDHKVVISGPDLAVTKQDDPDPVESGGLLTYTLSIVNLGPMDAVGVLLTDTLPTGLAPQSAIPSQGECQPPSNPVVCDLGSMPHNGTATVTIQTAVGEAVLGVITNTATIASADRDPNSANNTALEPTTVLQQPGADMETMKSDDPDPVWALDPLTYTLFVQNNGPLGATSVRLVDSLPAADMDFVHASWTSTQGSCVTGAPNVECDLADVPDMEGVTVTIAATVTLIPVAYGITETIHNTGAVTATEHDPILENNVDVEPTDVISPCAEVVLVIDVSGSMGQDDGTGRSKLEAAKEAAKAFVDLADLVHNKIAVVKFSADAQLVHPLSRNAATLRGAIDGLASGGTTEMGQGIAKATQELTGPRHNPLTFRSMVVMTDGLPNQGENPPCEAAAAAAKDAGIWIATTGYGTLVDEDLLKRLASGEPPDYHYAPDGDELKRIYEALAKNLCPLGEVPPSVDLWIAKVDQPDPVVAGADSLAYTITVENDGPALAEAVSVTDTLPLELLEPLILGVSQGSFGWDGGRVVTANLGSMPPTGTAYVWIAGGVTCTARNVMTNTARVTTVTPERDYSNNAVTVTTGISRVADVAVIKNDSDDPVIPKQRYTYTITMENLGPSSATDVMLTDTLPSKVEFQGVGAGAGGVCNRSDELVTCDWPEVMCGSATWVTISVKADPGGLIPRCGKVTVTNTVEVRAREWDPELSNNSDWEGTMIADPRICPDLGDAPDSTNHFYPFGEMLAYPGVLANFPSVFDPPGGSPRGPKHAYAGADAWLGDSVSYEEDADTGWDEDGTHNIDPPADEADLDGKDDSGVLAVLSDCGPGIISYSMVVTSTAITRTRYVNAWLDFNRDGDWADTYVCYENGVPRTVMEWAVRNEISELPPGVYHRSTPGFMSDNRPSGDSRLWMRITLSDAPAPLEGDGRGPEFGYQFGETEDYLLVEPPPYPPLGGTRPEYLPVWTAVGGSATSWAWNIHRGPISHIMAAADVLAPLRRSAIGRSVAMFSTEARVVLQGE
jgi:uncharacterized repeat protein (TIGR01451 family)